MRTGKVLKTIFMALCIGALVSCGSDNKSDSGTPAAPAPVTPVVQPVVTNVNLNGEGQYRAASNISEVRYNIKNGHFAKYNVSVPYNFSGSFNEQASRYKAVDYSCGTSVSKSDFLWWDDAIDVVKTKCGNSGSNEVFERKENKSGALVSAYGVNKILILKELFAIANASTAATVSVNPYTGRRTIARLTRGSKIYVIDFEQPIYANPVAEFEYGTNNSIKGYELKSQSMQ